MSSRKASVLVVDDDVRMLRMMQRMLEIEGHRVLKASSGEAALEVFDEEAPDLVLLDILMSGMDGYTVCRRIREFSRIPIIIVTVKDSDKEKIEGLDAGADDYVTKPFSPKVMAARIRAALRHASLWDEHPEPALRCDGLIVDFAQHKVTLHDREVNLTATEYRVLSYLARNADRVVTPDQILQRVWGEHYLGETNLLQVNMARLRRKLKDNARKPKYILTKHGIGYTMVKRP